MTIIYELLTLPDGTLALGPSLEVEEYEANELVLAGTHKIDGLPIGEILPRGEEEDGQSNFN